MPASKKKRLNKSFFRFALSLTTLLFISLLSIQVYFALLPKTTPSGSSPRREIIKKTPIQPINLPKTPLADTPIATVKFKRNSILTLLQISRLLSFASKSGINTYLIADSVEAINPGIYRYSDNKQLALVKPGIFDIKLFKLFRRLSLRDASGIIIFSSTEPVNKDRYFKLGMTVSEVVRQSKLLRLGYNTISATEYKNELINVLGLKENILYLLPLGLPE